MFLLQAVHTPRARIALALVALAVMTIMIMASLHTGVAHAQPPRSGVWYRCYVDGAPMWCMDIKP